MSALTSMDASHNSTQPGLGSSPYILQLGVAGAPTLPTGRNQGLAIAPGAPLSASLRQPESLQAAEKALALASRRLPQMMAIGLALCLVFILGLAVGLLVRAR